MLKRLKRDAKGLFNKTLASPSACFDFRVTSFNCIIVIKGIIHVNKI